MTQVAKAQALGIELSEHLTEKLSDICSLHFNALEVRTAGARFELNCFVKPAPSNEEAVAAFEALLPCDEENGEPFSHAMGISFSCFIHGSKEERVIDSVFIDRFTPCLHVATRKRSIHIDPKDRSSDNKDTRLKLVVSHTKSYIKSIVKELVKAHAEIQASTELLGKVTKQKTLFEQSGYELKSLDSKTILARSSTNKMTMKIEANGNLESKVDVQITGMTLCEDKIKKLCELLGE